MAKKNQEFNQVPMKNIDDMTDIEFITSADYLASPYYRAYMSAKARVSTGSSQSYQPLSSAFSQPQIAKGKNGKIVSSSKKSASGANYSKKRGLVLFLITLFMLVIIAISVLNVFNIEGIAEYSTTYIKPGVTEASDVNIGLLDPVYGLVKSIIPSLELDSVYLDNYLSNITTETNLITKISLYAVPAAAIIIMLCAVIGFLKGIGAMLAKKRANGLYKKSKFGFLSIIIFLCGAIILIGGIFVSGTEINAALDFIMQKTTALYAGYGLYALIVLPILTLILSGISYKKVK
jgi:hypothetical protein